MSDSYINSNLDEIMKSIKKVQNAKCFSQNTLKQAILPVIKQAIKIPTVQILAQDLQNKIMDKKIPPKEMLLRDKGLFRKIPKDPNQSQEQIQLAKYPHIYVQSIKQCQRIQKMVELQNMRIKSIIQKNSSFFSNIFQNSSDKKNSERLIKQSQVQRQKINQGTPIFLAPWNDTKCPFRVACIYQNENKNISNHFWIYSKLQQQSLLLKDRLHYIRMIEKHESLMNRLRNKFNTNVKQKLVEVLLNQVKLKQSGIRESSKIHQPQKPQSPKIYIPFSKFDAYQQELMSDLLKIWRNRGVQCQKRTRKKLFIEIKSIKLDKKLIPEQVFLIVDRNPKQKYRYSGSNQHHLIFVPLKKQVYMFQPEDFYHRNLEFSVHAIKGKTQKVYQHALTFEKIDEYVLGFSYQLGLISRERKQMPVDFLGSFPYILNLQAVVRNINFKMSDVVGYRKTRLLQQMGKIPNSYSGHFLFPYSPKTFKTVQSIVSSNNYPLTKQSFQRTYLDLANFIQLEENKSRNYCIYVSQFKKQYEQYDECYRIIHRMQRYNQKLKTVDQKIKYQQSLRQRMGSMRSQNLLVNHVNASNLNDDLDRCHSDFKFLLQKLMKRFILLIDLYNERQNGNFGKGKSLKEPQKSAMKYLSPLLKIGQRIINIAAYSDKYSLRDSIQIKADDGVDQILWLFFSFLKNLYPYFSVSNLKLQLLHIRVLVQKYLPQFNYTLNREGIGLENLASKHLLSLFTQLNTELTFRIWDLLLNFEDKMKGRIIIVYTLFLYYQVTEMLPIIPINQFVKAARQNYAKIQLQTNYVYLFDQTIQNYTKTRIAKQQKLISFAQQKYLKRFILSKAISSQPIENSSLTMDVNINPEARRKMLSLHELKYPLPEPKHMGIPVQKIQIFIHNINIIQNINVIKYRHIFVVSFGGKQQEFTIDSKNMFANKFIEIAVTDAANSQKQIVSIDVYGDKLTVSESQISRNRRNQRHLLTAEVKVQNFHKDKAYKISLNLLPVKQKVRQLHKSLTAIQFEPYNIKGQSTISLTLCLQSRNKKLKINQRQVEQQVIVLDRLLDYDWNSELNSGMKSVQNHLRRMEKMKRPLDEFGKEEYTNLRLSAFDTSIPEWLSNSKVTIEELRAIFSAIFYQQSQKDLQLQFSTIYQQFTSKKNYQQFDLGQMLLQMILLSDISRQKKLTLLFCMGVHYQNCLSKKISLETINSFIKQIHNQYGLLNAMPMIQSLDEMGYIQQGWFYVKGSKSKEGKRNITNILKDWVYMCKVRFGYSGIILGSNQDLDILRHLFAPATLKQINSDRLCRFQIIYCYNKHKYSWAMTVNTHDFSIAERGTKFLNAYPKYSDISYLDSTAQILLNCESIIPLQNNINKTYEQFLGLIKSQELLNYLITQSLNTVYDPNAKKSEMTLKQSVSPSYIRIPDKYPFKDYAIFRHENCIDEWKKCRIVKQEQGNPNCVVQFQDYPEKFFNVARFQLMNMSENLQWQQNSQLDSSINR